MSSLSWTNRVAQPFAIIAVLAVTILAGCGRRVEPTTPGADATPAATKVHLVRPEWKSVARVVQQPGTVAAYEETQLHARVAGYISKIHVDIGQRVTGPRHDAQGKETAPGQILAEISVPELEQETKQKQALTLEAEAEVEQAKKAVTSAEAAIAIAEAAVIEARAQRDRWSSESKRVAKLVEGGTLDVQTRDETINQAKATEARVLASEAAVRKAKADRDKMQADVRAAEAHVGVAKADALRAQAMLAYSKIRAPYDGIVTIRKVHTGNLVQPSGGKGEWLFSVARLDPVRVVMAVPEVDAELVEEGAKVALDIRAAQRTPLRGSVSRVSWSLDQGARTLRTEIDMPNKDGRLRPGMYAYAKIESQCPGCWTLPASAVVKQGDAMVCFVVADGKAARTPVQLGRSDGILVEVLKWQSTASPAAWQDWTGKELVADPAAGLSDGQTVHVTTAQPVVASVQPHTLKSGVLHMPTH